MLEPFILIFTGILIIILSEIGEKIAKTIGIILIVLGVALLLFF